jgi:hypothetical protein
MREREGQDPHYGEKSDQEPQYGDGSEGDAVTAPDTMTDADTENADSPGQAQEAVESTDVPRGPQVLPG